MSKQAFFNRVSKLFQPFNVVPKNALITNNNLTSKSQKLMLELGVIHQASPGFFHFLPLGVRVLEKLTKLIDVEMRKIQAQKVMFPALTSAKLWDKTGRLKDSSELFKIHDRHKTDYILSPTHEEAVSDLLGSMAPLSYKHFPLRLYQITSKYRDEIKPRFGLMRAREFVMKDLYTFDIDERRAEETYEAVCKCYTAIFKKIGVKFNKVLGTTGHVGGTISHEFHFPAAIGEDKLLTCSCSYSGNLELSDNKNCPECGSSDYEINHGIEVGHTFFLGDKYSKALNAVYVSQNKTLTSLQMGCYGLGVSRIIAAVVEALSSEQEMRWPLLMAPYSVAVIPPKHGSKEEAKISDLPAKLYESLIDLGLQDDFIVDDRVNLTIGRRYLEACQIGYPFVIVIGNKSTEDHPLLELNSLNSKEKFYFSISELLGYIKEHVVSKTTDLQ